MSILGDSQPLVEEKFAFLKKLTSARKHHGGKSFYQHLCNVYGYLKAQSFSEELCDAGLFHAVYGTESYNFQSAAITREVVRGYIGEYAEELVYVFCGLKNERFRSIVHNTPAWNAKMHLDLCRVEYANLWDHKDFRDVSKKMDTIGQVIKRLEGEAVEQTDFLPPPYPPRLLRLDQVAFLSHHGWLPIELSDATESAFQNVLTEAKSFFALEADVKHSKYPSSSATEHGFYTVPEEKEYVTFRYRANPGSLLENCVGEAWEKGTRLLHRILCDLACFHSYDPRMWDPFVEDAFCLPLNKSSMPDTSTFMRLFQYYPGGGVAEQHLDRGLLTLCIGTDSGFEVVEHCPDASRWIATQKAVVLVGRMASLLLHKEARPGRHRVVSNAQGRRSVVLALRPCLRAQIDLEPLSGQQQTISAREYFAKTSATTYNINAKRDLREEQRQRSQLGRDQQLDGEVETT